MLARSGRYSVSIANESVLFPMNHNWAQTLLVGRDWWGRTARFSVYTRSAGVQGRAMIMIQAYRDTATKMARVWGVDRVEAMRRLGIHAIDDPTVDLGWKRVQFLDAPPEWVRREVSAYVPAGTTVLFVRCGLMGTGQLLIDDASLTLEPTPPVAQAAKGTNLLADSGFENGGLVWEWSIPPFEGARIDPDSTVAHSGRMSMRCSNMHDGPVNTRAGLAQPISARSVRGQRIKLSAWLRADSLLNSTYLKIYSHSPAGSKQTPGERALSGTFDWTQLSIEYDVPKDADEIWPWAALSAPCRGTLWIDDVELTVLGPSAPPPPPPARARAKAK
jgi:hypothetical protein